MSREHLLPEAVVEESLELRALEFLLAQPAAHARVVPVGGEEEGELLVLGNAGGRLAHFSHQRGRRAARDQHRACGDEATALHCVSTWHGAKGATIAKAAPWSARLSP